jgi:RNA polymerase sigma factor (sigma-70 family)
MSTPTLSDGELIERFLTGEYGDAEDAFEALVKRHGPMVHEVCWKLLKRFQDVEDAFQETFLALARKAGTIRDHLALGGWLYEVAYRIAIRMRDRLSRQSRLVSMTDLKVTPEEAEVVAARNELRPIVQAELDRLPEKYRALVLHCYLEGKTNAEAARLLGCPVGTVKGRLWRARGMMRQRLSGTDL